MANAMHVLQSELGRKEDELFRLQQQFRSMQDEASRLRSEQQKVNTQTTARGEVRLIRKLKKTNSELWDVIQDYENKFTATEEVCVCVGVCAFCV